ncbi:MAG: triose-phosphate isomerase [Hyphomicrobiales bacterium]
MPLTAACETQINQMRVHMGAHYAAIYAQMIQQFDDTGVDIALFYDGSVKAGNAAVIFAVKDVDGALVGGASLKARDFVPIVNALKHS